MKKYRLNTAVAVTALLVLPMSVAGNIVKTDKTYWEEIEACFDSIYSPRNAYVGEIPFHTDVNEYGAAIIDIPLELPDVGDYMKPQLSFHYNNSQPASMFGNEWKLGGLSEIRRVSKSVYYDGIYAKAEEDSAVDGSEAFTLDGQRLVIQENNFPSTVSYQSEMGLVKATARFRPSDENPSGYEYASFMVRYPDGNTAIFGFEEKEKNEDPFHFPITRLENPFSQTIRYEYIYKSGEYRICRIRFGKNLEAHVNFNYTPVSAAFRKEITSDIWGKEIKSVTYKNKSSNCALSGVSITHQNKHFRDYTFIYRANESYLFLSEIHLVRKKEATLSPSSQDPPIIGLYTPGLCVLTNDTAEFAMPLRFTYGKSQAPEYSCVSGPTFAGHIPNAQSKKGAFGDERTNGVVIFPDESPGANGQIVILPDLEHTDTLVLAAGRGKVNVLCINMDQGPGDELVRVNNYVENGHDMIQFTVYSVDMEQGAELLYERTYQTDFTIENNIPAPKEFFIGNLTGRGETEVMAVSNLNILFPNEFPVTELYDLKENRVLFKGKVDFDQLGIRPIPFTGISDLIHRRHCWLPGDFDGDGQTEFFFRPDCVSNGVVIKYSASGDTVNAQCWGKDIKLANRNDYSFVTGDFNGDRRSDLYISSDGSVYVSDGETFQFHNITYYADTSWGNCFCDDINGDGCDDLVLNGESYFFADGHIWAKMSVPNGGGFTRQDYREPEAGKSELLKVSGDTFTRYSYGIDLSKPMLISGIKSSFNVETYFHYGTLKDSTIYRKTAPAPGFPYLGIHSAATVVCKVRTQLNGKVVDEKDFRYENGILHKQGLGFCGFEKVTISDSLRNQSTVRTFDPLRFNVPLRVETPTTLTVNTYDVKVAADKTVKAELKRTVQTDKLRGNTQVSSYFYDPYGQPVQEMLTWSNGLQRNTDFRYRNTDTQTQYRLGLLTSKTAYHYKDREYSSTGTAYTYDEHGAVTSTSSYYDNLLVTEVNTPRDADGRTLHSETRNYEGNALTTTYGYDLWGRLTDETGPTGLTTSQLYTTDGRLEAAVDVYGDTTRYEYDPFGRPVRTITPQGLTEETIYLWNIREEETPENEAVTVIDAKSVWERLGVPDPTADTRYAVLTRKYGQNATDTILAGAGISYFDALGREVRTAELRFDDSWLKQDKQYDSRGRLWKVSLPYKGDTPAGWDTYSYDAYDRPTRITYASGKEDTWTYSGNRVTSTSEGMSTTRTYNAAGQLTEVSDGGGTIRYTYRPDGQPASVEANGAVTTFAYDEYGRQTSITDPSAGVVQYEYDEAGRVTTQTDADGNVTGFEYDEFDRPLRKFTSELSTDYYYNAYGQPDSIVSDNGTSRSFTYDATGRTIKEQENAPDGKWLEQSISYDVQTGQVADVTYRLPTGEIGTEKYSYTNGHLTSIQFSPSRAVQWPGVTGGDSIKQVLPGHGGIVLPAPGIGSGTRPPVQFDSTFISRENKSISVWELKAENDLGKPTQVTTGNLTRTYEYDDYGMPTRREVRDTTSQMIFGQAYDFDAATGNLLSRTDLVQQATDRFTYDPLNRLASHTPAHGRTLTFSYADNGNSTERGGDYRLLYEDAAHPYWQTGLETADAETPVPDELFISSGANGLVKNISSHRQFLAGFTYDTDGRRVKMTLTHLYGGDLAEKYYLGGRYELDTHGEELLYLGGDAYSAPAVYRKEEGGSWKIHYICRDYLGSVCAITDADGQKVAAYSYDAWGNLRDPKTHELLTDQSVLFDRGYTGHEHMPSFGLINMNARLYDPLTGRFLAPDPYVQNPEHTQSYNRYAYALNNPLKYTDPSGELIYTYDYDRRCYVDEYGERVDYSDVHLAMFRNGYFRGSRGISGYFGNPTIIIGGGSGGAAAPGHTWKSTYISVGMMKSSLGTWQDGTSMLGELTTVGIVFREQVPIMDYFWKFSNETLNNVGVGLGGLESGWRQLSNASKNNLAYHIQRTLKDSGARVSTQTIKIGITSGLKMIGKTVGWSSVGITTINAFSDNHLSWGEGVKIGIGIATTLSPFGWIYGALDVGIMTLNNGVGLTDMIGNKIDNW